MSAPTYFQLSGELYATWPDGRLAVYRSVAVPHGYVSTWVAIPAPDAATLWPEARRGTRCTHLNDAGTPCKAAVMHGVTFCTYHALNPHPAPSADCPACDALNVCPSCAEKAR